VVRAREATAGDGVGNPLWGDGWDDVRALWPLDPTITFLNHGSFGATPRSVLLAQSQWRAEMEREPVHFLARRLPGLLEDARRAAAAFLHADPEDFAFVPNATAAVSTVLANLPLVAGERVVLTDHAYPAVIKAAAKTCEEAGADLTVVPIPIPLPAAEEIVSRFTDALGDRTRLAIIDHVTSSTAVIMPVEPMVAACRRRGVPVLVDAAHAPGMLPVDVGSMGADFWTGNFHKWCCAPKGSAALVVAPEYRATTHPLVTSHGYGGSFHDEFDWTGTADVTSWLCVPDALDVMSALGWDRVRAHNHALVGLGQRAVAQAVATEPPVPPGAYGSMAIVSLPEGAATTLDEATTLSARLHDEARIEAAVVSWNQRGYVRLSAQAYNRPADYDRLAEALPRFL
jgi:isopenicillin-N epimerase